VGRVGGPTTGESAWRHAARIGSLIGAAALIPVALFLLHLTGGIGALATAVAVTIALMVVAIRRRGRRGRRDLRAVAWRLTALLAVWNLVSFGHYVLIDNGDTTSERMATWGRNHGLGPAIDWLEVHTYDTPPSRTPAKTLTLAPTITVAPTTTPTTTAPTAATTPAGGVTTSSAPAVTTTTVPLPQAPAALTPAFAPALPGEGQWLPIAQVAGHDTMWATSIRPLPDTGGVVATMVVIDQTGLRSALFNGTEEPGGTWARGSHVPKELQPALLAAMNGGFRFEHINGGYMTEGKVVKPLRDGDATLAIAKDGVMRIGALGRDFTNDGSWASLRQNLILIVDGGQSQVARGISEGVWWGADYGRNVYVPRSAVCELADGRIAYALVADVNAEQLARSLIELGCVKAMQMDINGTWPSFVTYPHDAEGRLHPQLVDRRMGSNPGRFLNGSTKEFFAFFDAGQVPAGSVLDA